MPPHWQEAACGALLWGSFAAAAAGASVLVEARRRIALKVDAVARCGAQGGRLPDCLLACLLLALKVDACLTACLLACFSLSRWTLWHAVARLCLCLSAPLACLLACVHACLLACLPACLLACL